MAKLTIEQWAEVRGIWQADSRRGCQWLVDELSLNVSRTAVSQRAGNEMWMKNASLDSSSLIAAPKLGMQKVTLPSSKVTQKSYAPTSFNANIGKSKATKNIKQIK